MRLAAQVQARLAELEALNLPGARFELIRNQADLIHRECTDLRNRALVAAGVIFLVRLLFLRSVRTVGVVFATIALAILISLNMVYFGGLSLNLMILMGLALGFGLIVDNASSSWRTFAGPGRGARGASSETGAREVAVPIVAATLTTLIVFLPFLYLQGELRIIYLPLVLVVALTLVASILVAFTSSRTHRAGPARRAMAGGNSCEGRGGAEGPPLYVRFYAGLPGYTLRYPWVMVAVVCLGASWVVFDEHVPRGRIFGGGNRPRPIVGGRADHDAGGSDLERMDELMRYFEERLARMPEVERFEAWVSSSGGTIRVDFPEALEHTPVQLAIEERLRGFRLGFTGADVRIFGQGSAFYGVAAAAPPTVRIRLLGYNYEHLAEIAEALGRRLSQHSRVLEMNTNATVAAATARRSSWPRSTAERRTGITSRCARWPCLVQSLVLGGGTAQQTIVVGGDPLGYEVKLAGFRVADVDALRETVVTTSRGTRVPLGELVDVREREVRFQIRRENQQYERTVAYAFRGPQALCDVIRNAAIAATELPPGYASRVADPGRSRTRRRGRSAWCS